MNKLEKIALGIIGIGVGITVGTAIYMFKTGKSLKETKNTLTEKTKDVINETKDIISETKENTIEIVDKTSDCAKDLIADYKEKIKNKI